MGLFASLPLLYRPFLRYPENYFRIELQVYGMYWDKIFGTA